MKSAHLLNTDSRDKKAMEYGRRLAAANARIEELERDLARVKRERDYAREERSEALYNFTIVRDDLENVQKHLDETLQDLAAARRERGKALERGND
ncbi:hypothetical protein LG047_18095 [Methylocystis sp. WRRC1]|uniref:hypothetical protein n=1 Tax=Methylocystis sp. WRRC1 TaxID=1732014 RepID=UPI001D1424AD|nr:hypothetical protein [Methylocystis sp. WRRC1]MCC3247204.1 hypothetical protein [Methylocystis sp. WRRC1]